MPSFTILADPPAESPAVEPVQACPYANSQTKVYRIVGAVQSRAGGIPLQGLKFKVDGADVGATNAEGKTPPSPMRQQQTASIEVIYENTAERLRKEVFSVSLTRISADSKSFTAGKAKNFISKVQDVFGSTADQDFSDEYAASVRMEDTGDPDVKEITVDVKMATLSLQVPYLSQVGDGETIQTAAPTPAKPAGKTATFRGSIICMPTSTTMCIQYWGITAEGGAGLTRNALMQECWDADSSPSEEFPCPWQNWEHLRDTVGSLTAAAHPSVYRIATAPASSDDSASVPSAYADGLLTPLTAGSPIVNSTYATSGHVMVVRGAVVKHDGTVQWLILNDPYGNLATSDSVYDQLDLSGPVGLRGTHVGAMNAERDVRAVREVLARLGHYKGALDGPIDENDREDPTVAAIRAFQKNGDGRVDPNGTTEKRLNAQLAKGAKDSYSGSESEANLATGAGSDRGRHVYYNGMTEATGIGGTHRFRLKTSAWSLMIEKVTPLTSAEVRQKLVRGA